MILRLTSLLLDFNEQGVFKHTMTLREVEVGYVLNRRHILYILTVLDCLSLLFIIEISVIKLCIAYQSLCVYIAAQPVLFYSTFVHALITFFIYERVLAGSIE